MTAKNFNKMIIAIGVMSEIIHPSSTDSWVYLSIAAYAVCAVCLIALIVVCICKRKKAAIKAASMLISVFVAYAEITVICYMRMIDQMINAEPIVIVICIATIGMCANAINEY